MEDTLYFVSYNDFARWCKASGYDPEFVDQDSDAYRCFATAYIKHADEYWREVFFYEAHDGDVWDIEVYPKKFTRKQEVVQGTKWVYKGVDD